MAALAALVFTLGPTGSVAAQEAGGQEDAARDPGRVTGRVVGSQDAAPVSSAQVRLKNTDIGTLTDVQGRYFLRDVPAGTYELMVQALGYAQKTVTGVTVRAGETTGLDLTLETDAIAVGDITVSAEQARGSAAAVLDHQRTAPAVVDGIGSEQISRSTASNAAETAKQLTGVTVSEGKYVYVRGLGNRYSQTNLNGSPLPSPEPEKGVVTLDLFPAGFLESLTVQKTYTPDQPGDFSGGSVGIETKEYPGHFTFAATVGSSVNAQSQFAGGFLDYDGGGTDFLGFDDGTRDLPGLVKDELGGLGGEQVPADPEARERFGESFLTDGLNQFTPSSGDTPANLDLGFSMGGPPAGLGLRTSATSSPPPTPATSTCATTSWSGSGRRAPSTRSWWRAGARCSPTWRSRRSAPPRAWTGERWGTSP